MAIVTLQIAHTLTRETFQHHLLSLHEFSFKRMKSIIKVSILMYGIIPICVEFLMNIIILEI